MAEVKYKFPSEEWTKAFKEAINQSKVYEEAARDWEGDFLFIITPDEKFPYEEVYYVDLRHGKCREARKLVSREEAKAEFTFEGPYSNWVKLLKGELDPVRALLMRKFKLTGSMVKLMRYPKAAVEIMKTITKIPAELLD